MPFNVLDVIELGCQGVLDINDDDFPIGLAFVEEGHDTKNLDLLDLADIAYLLTNLADVQGIVVPLGLGFGVHLRGVLPGLRVTQSAVANQETVSTDLRESTVIPDVTVVGETVPDIAQLASLDVLLDGVERLLFGDLHLGVGPAGDFYDHVEDALVLISKEGDIVPGRDDRAILLSEDTMF